MGVIFDDFRGENYTKTRFCVIFGIFLKENYMSASIGGAMGRGARSAAQENNKKQATPIWESGLPDKDLQNAYALAFTVFQISVYLSSRASDV